MALKVTINGQPRVFEELATGSSVVDLVAALELKSDRVALEHNGEIASRTAWAQTTLADGDKVEVVHFVGGGSNDPESCRRETRNDSPRFAARGVVEVDARDLASFYIS